MCARPRRHALPRPPRRRHAYACVSSVCQAFDELGTVLDRSTIADLVKATSRRHLAYDHVEQLTPFGAGTIASFYVARGKPDLWQPWTRESHRRVVTSDQWVFPRPVGDSWAAIASARQKLGFVETMPQPPSVAASVYWYPRGSSTQLQPTGAHAIGLEEDMQLLPRDLPLSALIWPTSRRTRTRIRKSRQPFGHGICRRTPTIIRR